jgi:anti-sigma28 factor (negative regulator of flagellin synthesis)
MTINHVLPSQVRASGVQRPKGEDDSKVRKDSDESPSRGRTDTVEISSEGRVLASRSQEVQGEGSLSPERLKEVRGRVDDGTYDSAEVAEEVARRILRSGDLVL